jgi:hypothetical protein
MPEHGIIGMGFTPAIAQKGKAERWIKPWPTQAAVDRQNACASGSKVIPSCTLIYKRDI